MVPTELTCLQGEENCLWYQQNLHAYKEKKIVWFNLGLCGTNRTYMFTRRRELSLIPTEHTCLQGEENCPRFILGLCDTNRAYMFTRRRELSLIPTEPTCLQGEENCLWFILGLCDTNRTYMFTRRRELSLIHSRLVWYQRNLHVHKEKKIVPDLF